MDERAFYSESRTKKTAQLNCPNCRTVDSYELEWLVRKKKDRVPAHDEMTRAKFAKAQSYIVLIDNYATCKSCRKRFEISGIKTMAFC